MTSKTSIAGSEGSRRSWVSLRPSWPYELSPQHLTWPDVSSRTHVKYQPHTPCRANSATHGHSLATRVAHLYDGVAWVRDVEQYGRHLCFCNAHVTLVSLAQLTVLIESCGQQHQHQLIDLAALNNTKKKTCPSNANRPRLRRWRNSLFSQGSCRCNE